MNNLETDIKYLRGVGPFRAAKLKKLGIETFEDLINFFPRDYINREVNKKISDIHEGELVSMVGKIVSVRKRLLSNNRTQLIALISDGRDYLECKWFRFSKWLIDYLTINELVWISGYISIFSGNYQIIHPEIEILESIEIENDFWKNRKIIPVYRITEGLTNKCLREIMSNAFDILKNDIDEVLPAKIIEKQGFKQRNDSLEKIHFPNSIEQVSEYIKRFKYEELFFNQLMLCRTKKKYSLVESGYSFKLFKTLTTALKENLTFNLTSAQKKVIREIVEDMQKPKQMNRLLQGDVGSGKTIVTLFSLLLAVENGYQGVIMAPTEILAKQHFKNIQKYLQNNRLNTVKVVLITGGVSKDKKNSKEFITSGDADIIIGTHALLEDDVLFNNAGLVAIDEQHRFGVKQRAKLIEKNKHPDILYLSATPIPRSLALTLYGDLDISIIDELPPNRKNIKTLWKTEKTISDVYIEMKKQINEGRQVYVVCPLVKESEKLDLLDATNYFNFLNEEVFKNYNCALLHGKMKSDDKNRIMEDFQNRNIDILVSTTVIEVGVDNPNATVMVIHHSERFGLSQLHQLRGRVGRGSDESFCFLVSYYPMSETARERLRTMVSTQNGFEIAEKDLEIRGPGEFFGTSQSGLPLFKYTNLIEDKNILESARTDALEITRNDYSLEKPEHNNLKIAYFKKYYEKEKLFSF